jgi:hypothetical protein
MTSIIGKGYKIGKDGKLKKTVSGYALMQMKGRSKRANKKPVSRAAAKSFNSLGKMR